MSGTAGQKTTRVTVKIGAFTFRQVVRAVVARDLQNIAGTFDVVLQDDVRLFRALPGFLGKPEGGPEIGPGQAITIAIDGEVVLIGWIDRASFRWGAETIECHIQGRDKAGDLVDCAALPDGPAEFRGVDLLHVAKAVCAPYGITVRAEVDIGAPFVQLALHPHQTALSFLESAARQRAVLLVSDGVGGLLLTRGGATRAPDALRLGENVQEINTDFDWSQRFSHYYVKQQAARINDGSAPAMTHESVPADHDDAGHYGAASKAEARRIINTGIALDPQITRYRPTVRLTRTQSGMTSVQEQAEWMLRLARGMSDRLHVRVLDWRAGKDRVLWRPNALVDLWDPYSGLDKEMLIAGIAYRFSEQGAITELRVAGRTAYDRINEAERERKRHRGKKDDRKLDSTPVPLTAPGETR